MQAWLIAVVNWFNAVQLLSEQQVSINRIGL